MASSDAGTEAEHARGRGVDRQLERARLHDRQVSGLSAFEDATRVDTHLTIGGCGLVREDAPDDAARADGPPSTLACVAVLLVVVLAMAFLS